MANRYGNTKGERVHYISQTTFTLDNQYSDLKILGKGSYGVVVSAFSERLQQKIAIKKVTPVAKHVVDAKHVLRETRLLRYMGQHENIITLEDINYREQADELYFVMELMDSDLHRIIQSKQVLTEQHFQYFMFQLCCGLKYLHDHRIIHRDLKPGNLLVSKDCRLRITDFGLARERPQGKGEDLEESIDTPMTEHVVTRWYRPPELMLCPDGMYDYAVDIWSCGCILAEMLKRDPIFPGKNFVHQLNLVFDVIGSPRADEVQHIVNHEAKKFLSEQAKKKKVPFATIFPQASADAIELLEGLLIFNPTRRITVDDALESSFMRKFVHANSSAGLDLSKSLMYPPVNRKEFEFSFERHPNMTRQQLKALIHQEVVGIKREKYGASYPGASSGTTTGAATAQRKGSSASTTTTTAQATAETTTAQPAAPAGTNHPKASHQHHKNDTSSTAAHVDNSTSANGATAGDGKAVPSYLKATTSSQHRAGSAPRMRPGATGTSGLSRTGNASSSRNLLEKVQKMMADEEEDAYDTLKLGKQKQPPAAQPAAASSHMAGIAAQQPVTGSATAASGRQPATSITTTTAASIVGQKPKSTTTQEEYYRKLLEEDEDDNATHTTGSGSRNGGVAMLTKDIPIVLHSPSKKLQKSVVDPVAPSSPLYPSKSIRYESSPVKSMRYSHNNHQGASSTVQDNAAANSVRSSKKVEDMYNYLASKQEEMANKARPDQLKQVDVDAEEDTEEESTPVGPSTADLRKSLMETYTSPKRLASNTSNALPRSPKPNVHNFPDLAASPQRVSKAPTTSMRASYHEEKKNDDDEDDEDLASLRQQLRSSSLRMSKRKAAGEEDIDKEMLAKEERDKIYRASLSASTNKLLLPREHPQPQKQVYRSPSNSRSPSPEPLPIRSQPPVKPTSTTAMMFENYSQYEDKFQTRPTRHSTGGSAMPAPPAAQQHHANPPVPHYATATNHLANAPPAHPAANLNATTGQPKKKITVPKSPKFSTMSWQKKQQLEQEEMYKKTQTDNAKKRSTSTGRMRM